MRRHRITRGHLPGSVVLLAVAGFIAVRLFAPAPARHPNPVKTRNLAQVIQEKAPTTDPILAGRLALEWGETAVHVAEQYGRPGLRTLDYFGEDATYVMEEQPDAFRQLGGVLRLDPGRFRLAGSAWRTALCQWAENGQIEQFVKLVKELPADRLEVAFRVPAALPLLGEPDLTTAAPTVQSMLDQYGDRAWRLFSLIDFLESREPVERVAKALDEHGERMLDLYDHYGLYAALLLVPPNEPNTRRLPEVVISALKGLDEPTALTLMLTNLPDLKKQLEKGRSIDALKKAVGAFGALPEVERSVAADHPQVLRLLAETWERRPIGVEAFHRCGPAAADITYRFYGSSDVLRTATLLSLGAGGWPAYQVFDDFHGYNPFYDLLRRPELLDPSEKDHPLIVDLIAAITKRSASAQQEIDKYLHVPNLRGELARVSSPRQDAVLEWIPGYIAVRTASDWAHGYHVTGGDAFWAVVDGVTTATMVYGIAANASKSIASRLVAKAAGETERQGLREAAETLGRQGDSWVRRLLGRSTRFGDDAERVATARADAQAKGLLLKLPDRREAWSKAGDQGRNKVAEQIGMEGAEKYASKVGYKAVWQGKTGQGAGFDFVWRDGNTIVIGEAKGLIKETSVRSALSSRSGYLQGTEEYARATAEWHLTRPGATEPEKAMARDVLGALDNGQVRNEFVVTRHIHGKPGATTTEATFGPRLGSSAAQEVGRAVGFGEQFFRQQATGPGLLTAGRARSAAAGVARSVGIPLRILGIRATKVFGRKRLINLSAVPVKSGGNAVGELAVALMEERL